MNGNEEINLSFHCSGGRLGAQRAGGRNGTKSIEIMKLMSEMKPGEAKKPTNSFNQIHEFDESWWLICGAVRSLLLFVLSWGCKARLFSFKKTKQSTIPSTPPK